MTSLDSAQQKLRTVMTPTDIIANYSATSGVGAAITIPIASLQVSPTGLTDAEADAATGNGVAVLYELLRHIEARFNGLPPAVKSKRMSIARGKIMNPSDPKRSTVTFAVAFEINDDTADVLPEPIS